jgi:hypothetical protein
MKTYRITKSEVVTYDIIVQANDETEAQELTELITLQADYDDTIMSVDFSLSDDHYEIEELVQ